MYVPINCDLKFMKLVIINIITSFFLFEGLSQGNKVFSGGEMANNDVVDISAVNGIFWSTERAAIPGYFSVLNNASYIGCSDSANIDGYIKKYGNTAFIFPVGNGNDLRAIEISAPALITDAYAVAWISGNPGLNLDPTSPNAGPHAIYSFSPPLVEVSSIGQWDWQVGQGSNLGNGTTGTGEGLMISVSIPDMTSFASKNNLRLVGWDGNKWVNLSKSSPANGNTENSILRGTMIAGITAIGIGRVESALSLKLEEFLAFSSECNAILKWITSGESTTERFIIERSFDAVHFQAIDSLLASGFSFGSQYTITLVQPIGVAYYRLKIKDMDGSFAYSPMVSCQNNCKINDAILVYPNPVSGFDLINVRFTTSFTGDAEYVVFNSIGQRIITNTVDVKSGQNLFSIPIEYLSAGTYFIILLKQDGNLIGGMQKFIKQ